MSPVDLTPFQRIVDGSMVEDAVSAHLQKWYSTYLAALEEQSGITRGSWARPRSWITTAEFDSFPEAQLPAVLLISPGLAASPEKSGGRGVYRAKWSLATAVIVQADTRANAIKLAKKHAAALRWVLIQKASIAGFAVGVDWLGESYDDLSNEQSRSIAAGKNLFSIEVDDVLTQRAGPAAVDPLSDPLQGYDADVEVHTVKITETVVTP